MADGIIKGVGEGLGELVKQVVTDAVKLPGDLAGIGVDETKGQGTGSSSNQTGKSQKSQNTQINDLAKQDEIDKQAKLAQARRLLQQVNQPAGQPEPSVSEKIEMEEEQKKQAEEIKQQSAMQELPKTGSKPKPGNLYGKQTGSETKMNVKAQ